MKKLSNVYHLDIIGEAEAKLNEMNFQNFDTYSAEQFKQAHANNVAAQHLGIAPSAPSANVTLKVKRLTANIAQPLPVPLFGSADFAANYAQTLLQCLKNGITLKTIKHAGNMGATASASEYTHKISFEYQLGGNIDIVEVSIEELPILSFLAFMGEDKFVIGTSQYGISDVTKLVQFQQRNLIYDLSLFGAAKNDGFTAQTYRSTKQNQNDIVDIKVPIYVNKNRTLVLPIINVADFTISFTCFISKTNRG